MVHDRCSVHIFPWMMGNTRALDTMEERIRVLVGDLETTTAVVIKLLEARAQQTTTTPIARTGGSPAPPPPIFHTDPGFPNFNISACRRLSRREFTSDEVGDLIEAVFSSAGGSDEFHFLCGDDAQTFVDVIYGVRRGPTRHCEIRLIENLYC